MSRPISDTVVPACVSERASASTPGVTVITACMNRNEHLAEVIGSWLPIADEIVIVDWSSSVRVIDTLANVIAAHPDVIRIVEVRGQPRWQLSPAFNLAARWATRDTLLKLDCDDMIVGDFIGRHPMTAGGGSSVFYCGDWTRARTPQETFLNGVVMCRRDDFFAVGAYNEYISTYGWDDSDLYERLAHVAQRRCIDNDTVTHLPHGARSRADTYVEIQYNRLLCTHANMHAKLAPRAVYRSHTCTRAMPGGRTYQYRVGTVEISAHVPDDIHNAVMRDLHGMLATTRPDSINDVCIVLQNGIGNKLRALTSGIALYRWLRRECHNKFPWRLTVVWPIDEHCGAAHDDLFTVESLTGGDTTITFSQTIPAAYGHGAVALRTANVVAASRGLDTGAAMVGMCSHTCAVVAHGGATASADCVQPDRVQPDRVQPDRISPEGNGERFVNVIANPRPNHVYIESATVINFPAHSWREDCAYLRTLVPVPAIASAIDIVARSLPVDVHSMTGVHVRAGTVTAPDDVSTWPANKQEAWREWRGKSQYEVFAAQMRRALDADPNTHFYIASDSPDVYTRAQRDFGSHVHYYERDVHDRSREQVVTGLIDVIMLSRTRRLYGSNWSSFTELAIRLGASCLYAGKDF